MPMKPNDGESQDDFMERCVPEMIDSGHDQDSAVAACSDMWDRRGKMNDKERKAPPMKITKQHVSKDTHGMEFILSDTTPDRYGDIVNQDGWQLSNFKKNPIALFNHDPDFVIGTWTNIKSGKDLRARLELAPEGTSDRIDEIRRLVEADILRGCSVGFKPIKVKGRFSPDGEFLGEIYQEQELVETSLVSIPANPNALAIAKQLQISKGTIDLVFAGHGVKNGGKRGNGSTGEHARRGPNDDRSGRMTSPLADRIGNAEKAYNDAKDELITHLDAVDDTNVSDAQLAKTQELNEKVASKEKVLSSLREAEGRLAASSMPVVARGNGGGGNGTTEIAIVSGGHVAAAVASEGGGSSMLLRGGARPFAQPVKKVKAEDYIWRALTVQVKHHLEGHKRHIVDVIKETYGECDMTKAMVQELVIRSATSPATTTTTGWAAELVQTAFGDFFDALMPISIYPQLASRGARFTFGRNGIVSLPYRQSTPTIAGSFVAQGAPIPVRQGAFAALTLTPKKMGVISTFTREIAEHSTPSIEALIRQTILEDTAVSIDAVLMDNVAASATRPAGLRNGVSTLTPTGAGGIAAVIGDLKAMVAALITGSAGNFRSPVWIMNPADALAIALTQAAAGGDLPFRDEIGRGVLLGYPIIQSTSVTADTVYLVDAADFASAAGDTPRFDVSDQAVLHMEDTTPLALSSTGSPNTVAAPVRSLWQTDTLGIRMLLDINWAMRRTGLVIYTTGVTWN